MTGVVVLAVRFATGSYLHISFPSVARTPTAAFAVKPTIARTPWMSAARQEEYPAGSLSSLLVQTVLPLILSRATRLAPSPPGVTIRLLPSTSGDSLISQPGLLPPKSLRMLRRQTTAPSVVFRQARSPFSDSA